MTSQGKKLPGKGSGWSLPGKVYSITCPREKVVQDPLCAQIKISVLSPRQLYPLQYEITRFDEGPTMRVGTWNMNKSLVKKKWLIENVLNGCHLTILQLQETCISEANYEEFHVDGFYKFTHKISTMEVEDETMEKEKTEQEVAKEKEKVKNPKKTVITLVRKSAFLTVPTQLEISDGGRTPQVWLELECSDGEKRLVGNVYHRKGCQMVR